MMAHLPTDVQFLAAVNQLYTAYQHMGMEYYGDAYTRELDSALHKMAFFDAIEAERGLTDPLHEYEIMLQEGTAS